MKRVGEYTNEICTIAVLLALAISCICLHACHKDEHNTPYAPTPYTIAIPLYFPNNLNIPHNNPMTTEGVALGKKLFFDTRITESGMCCATCHCPENAFDCGTQHTPQTHHNVMPLFNLVFNSNGYLWNGSVAPTNGGKNIEDIVLATITDPAEFNATPDRVVATLSQLPEYAPLFQKAFGSEEINIDRVCRAIAQYVRTLVSGNSKFDRYLRGEAQLTPEELRGYVLFTTEEGADCFHCHGSEGNPLFTTNQCYNNALQAHPTDPLDRYAVTQNENDRGAYKAPSLRNIGFTAPYMHDGRFSTIDQVLQFYNEGLQPTPYASVFMHKLGQGGACLSASQLADLKAFLNTLNDTSFVEQHRNEH